MASKYNVEYIAGGKVLIMCTLDFGTIASITSLTKFHDVQVLLKIQSELLRYDQFN